MRWTLAAAGLLGLVSVTMGAIGAHAIEPSAHESWSTAVNFALLHVLACMGCVALARERRLLRFPAWGFLVGAVLFSGSIWVRHMVPGTVWTTGMAPAGGVTLMASWATMAAIAALVTTR